MIDIENAVFDYIAKALRAAYKGIFVGGEPDSTPSSFPAVLLWEQDNSVYAKSQTTECTENHATVMYECDVYSNLASGKKQEAKKIAAFIDATMAELGFIRTFGQPIPNLADATIYRYKLRFKGVVSKDYMIFTK